MKIRTTNLGFIDTIPRKVRKQERSRACIQRIFDLFEPFGQRYKKEKGESPVIGCWVDATEFIYPLMTEGGFSTGTINRAKKALGIKTRPIKRYDAEKKTKKGRPVGAGTLKWVWLYPSRSVDSAIVQLNDSPTDPDFIRNVLEPIARKAIEHRCQRNRSVALLRDIMVKHNYCISAVRGMQLAEQSGYSRRTMLRAKKVLRVISRQSHGNEKKWFWVWAAPEVCRWFDSQFEDGKSVTFDDLLERAQAQGWEELVVREARVVSGGIHIKKENGKMCWYDVNIRVGTDD